MSAARRAWKIVRILMAVTLVCGVLTAATQPSKASSAITVAAAFHTCAITDSGALECWGLNTNGQLGDGTSTSRSSPTAVTGLGAGVTQVTASADYTCALNDAGGVRCWGYNGYGALGDGTRTSRRAPVDVVGLTGGVQQISALVEHTCALTTAGGVKCWGSNYQGELGDGTSKQRSAPVDVVGLSSGVTAVSVGASHTCALTVAGGVKCWGGNPYGVLGDGTKTERHTPVDVVGLTSGVAAISASWYHTCALMISGSVKCWGSNEHGLLGDGTIKERHTPVDVVGLTHVTQISANAYHSCALTSDGLVHCWGSNAWYQLGTGTRDVSRTPRDVIGLPPVRGIATGLAHTCALTDIGSVSCWGRNTWGELGDGTRSTKPYPVVVRGFRGSDASLFRPDGSISPMAAGPWRGDDVYNSTGNDQALSLSIRAGETIRFFVRVSNDSQQSDRIFVSGTAGTHRLAVAYNRGSADITPAITAGTWSSTLQPSGSVQMRVVVTAADSVPDGTRLVIDVRVESSGNSRQIDIVRATVRA